MPGKTGSVNFDPAVNPPAPYGEGSSDIWYCSYTNGGYAISVWTGYDVPNESPQVPDYYKGQQQISRDLQKLLNGNREVPDWEMPKGVERISGSGLSAHYRVTDSKDLDKTGISWADVSGYGNAEIDKAKPDNSVPEDWEEYEFSPWYDYYREHGTSVPDVIGPELYKDMKGRGGS